MTDVLHGRSYKLLSIFLTAVASTCCRFITQPGWTRSSLQRATSSARSTGRSSTPPSSATTSTSTCSWGSAGNDAPRRPKFSARAATRPDKMDVFCAVYCNESYLKIYTQKKKSLYWMLYCPLKSLAAVIEKSWWFGSWKRLISILGGSAYPCVYIRIAIALVLFCVHGKK